MSLGSPEDVRRSVLRFVNLRMGHRVTRCFRPRDEPPCHLQTHVLYDQLTMVGDFFKAETPRVKETDDVRFKPLHVDMLLCLKHLAFVLTFSCARPKSCLRHCNATTS